ERAGFHGCQMPEQLLGRIIRCCSDPGDLVLDPFSGSATTLVVAKKLARNWIGFDLSDDYVRRGRERVAAATIEAPLEGALEPTLSAPSTPSARLGNILPPRGRPAKTSNKASAAASRPVQSAPASLPVKLSADFDRAILAAFRRSNCGFSVDRIVADD